MKSLLYKNLAQIMSLGVFLIGFPAVGQVLTLKSGSVIEKRLPRGQAQEIQVMDTRGILQWELSDDGINWAIVTDQTEPSIVVEVNDILFLRCAIREANCDRVYSDVLKLIPFDLATVTTKEITQIEKKSAVCGGKIISDGGDPIQQKGVCWSLNSYPTLADSKTVDGAGAEDFLSILTDLTAGTMFYVRAYATNTAGTAYGNQVVFTTAFDIALPVVATLPVYGIAQTTAVSGGTIMNDGGGEITSRGVCWATTSDPTIADSKTSDGTGTGSFTSRLTGLTGNTIYFLRAFATNSAGTSYGDQESFATKSLLTCDGTFTDTRNGHNYCYKTIGSQTWMTENLDYLPAVGPSSQGSETMPEYYVYDYQGNNISEARFRNNYATYGVLYNWDAAINACPDTWHLPDNAEWGKLLDYLGSSPGGKMKETSTTHWKTPNVGASNESGLTVVPGGYRDYEGKFDNLGSYALFWSSSESGLSNAWRFLLYYGHDTIDSKDYSRSYGFSVRCLKNTYAIVSTSEVTGISQTTASSGGNVTSEGGTHTTARGVCWSTSTSPTTADAKTIDGTGIGSFVSSLTGLAGNTAYYVRSYAINSAGTSYGNEVSFKTSPVLPTVTTHTVTAITQITATSGGNITHDGGAPVITRGVCWSTTANPTITDNKTSGGAGTGSFISSLTGLNGNTTYYVRAYATNSAGTSYGNQVSFKTSPVLPTVTTATVYDITQTTASSGGTVTNDGGAVVTARGVCWSTSASPTTADAKTTSGSGMGSFASTLTGLTGNAIYYTRAYATNSAGTSYGNEISFKTSPVLPTVTTVAVTSITQTTAVSGGTVISDGGSIITARGVCWSISSNPTTGDAKTINGTGTGSFVSNLTGLTGNTTYYVRAYATNSAGTSYGGQENLKTSGPSSCDGTFTDVRDGQQYCYKMIGNQIWMSENLAYLPSVSPPSFGSEISPYYYVYDYLGTSVAEARNNENYNIYGALYNWEAARYGCPSDWHLPSDGEWTALTEYLGTSPGGKMKEANPSNWYTPNIGATNESGFSALPGGYRDNDGDFENKGNYALFWSSTENGVSNSWRRLLYYGNDEVERHDYSQSFGFSVRCLHNTLATVATLEVTEITPTTASSGGTIMSDGGSSVTARGVCWSNTTSEPTIGHQKTVDGAGIGTFKSLLTGLAGNTTYYIRAYATNSYGTNYGRYFVFNTPTDLPRVTTKTISAITQTTAVSGGNVTSDGGSIVNSRGICWSISSNPTLADNTTTDGAGTGSFTSSLSGLTGGTTYFVRAYAINDVGISYGNEVSFKTSPLKPTITTTNISAITQTTALSGGDITNNGGANVTERGVCWSATTSEPTTAHPRTKDGTGSGSFSSILKDLTQNTTYYVRAYATNSAGTGYGNCVIFTTSPVMSLTTSPITDISQTTATSGGNIISDGGAIITARGVCWSTTTSEPTTDHPKTIDGTGNGQFTSHMTGLVGNTTYYVRAYVISNSGTNFGNTLIFKTKDWGGDLNGYYTDARDNHLYHWIKIGSQIWMVENLAWLPAVSPYTAGSYTNPYYYVYGYMGSMVSAAKATPNYNTYGVLYNWPAAMTACPSGWHLPTDEEWKILEMNLGMNQTDADSSGWRYSGTVGGKMKESGTGHWKSPNIGASNSSDFTALPGGYQTFFGGIYHPAGFFDLGDNANFWSASLIDASNAWLRLLSYNNDVVLRYGSYQRNGFSVRCLQN